MPDQITLEPIVLANVCRVDLITEETTPTLLSILTDDEAGLEPAVDEGGKNTLRVKNMILARNDFEDLVIGYTVTLKDVRVYPQQLAWIDGGTISATDSGLFVYKGPEIGKVLSRKRLTIDIWTEEKDADGDSLSYMRFRVQHAKGKPVSFSFKDGEFFAPEYSLDSKPKIGEAPMGIEQFLSLPSDELTAQQLLDLTNAA